MKCEQCRGPNLTPSCCNQPSPELHRIIVEAEIDVYAVTPEDDDIEEQVVAALKAGAFDIISTGGWE